MARVADQLIETLRNDIRSGVLRPGDQLEEAALAERFGVSRTPVREAVRSLVDSGLLETKPRKGALVRVLSAKELIDLFEVAAELEGMACRLAAERLTAGKAAALEDALQFCRKAADANDQDGYAKANLAFHQAIHNAAGNSRLIEQIEQLAGHINPYRAMPFQMRGRLQKSTEEHAAIAEAILENTGTQADELMRDHMMLQGQRLPMILEAIEPR
ncbi:GntR family transcriptional regulator [uncultured Roseibium sp.]|uniref:GntR family transcriptional regulator n=1 Tax=uncultured Roseibium sp. TaxID=1936171 RepID=UPI00260E9465|nr:GntR family transcriptional regulator [uncultured Roseibium sp.]